MFFAFVYNAAGVPLAAGVPGLAARWANGNTATTTDVKVWESWSGGNL